MLSRLYENSYQWCYDEGILVEPSSNNYRLCWSVIRTHITPLTDRERVYQSILFSFVFFLPPIHSHSTHFIDSPSSRTIIYYLFSHLDRRSFSVYTFNLTFKTRHEGKVNERCMVAAKWHLRTGSHLTSCPLPPFHAFLTALITYSSL